ncbi:MAG: hypothetical protein U9O41_00175 [Candidatus Aerophobetes bacterium]|nr:hypothetical protein [Candidatus Aerophobetes bacterium]
MKFNVDKLLELGLLRRIPKSEEKAEESIKSAETNQQIRFLRALIGEITPF